MELLLDDSSGRFLGIERFIIHNGQPMVDGFEDFLAVENAEAVHFTKRDRIDNDSNSAMYFVLLLLDNQFLKDNLAEIKQWLRCDVGMYSLLLVDEQSDILPDLMAEIPHENLFTVLSASTNTQFFLRNLSNAFNTLYSRMETLKIRTRLVHRKSEIDQLTRIGVALSNERDHTKLLQLILDKLREITRSDGGSIYLTERKDPTKLRFKLSALNLGSEEEFILPIDRSSLAGYVALSGEILNLEDAYDIPPSAGYSFNNSYDEQHGYRTKSMLVLPMKNHKGKVVGVVQLINRMKTVADSFDVNNLDAVVPFDPGSVILAQAVTGQATVAIENNLLLLDIEELFEGFITASVSAIESRDPTTSGHSFRVADLTVRLAELADKMPNGFFRNINFSAVQLRELKYAALLHDFGKIGVREEVLLKAKKLYPEMLEVIQWRFDYIKKSLEANMYKSQVDFLSKHGRSGFDDYKQETLAHYHAELARMQELFDLVIEANEPQVLDTEVHQTISDMVNMRFPGPDRRELALLKENEAVMLSIPRGTLDETERREIESHVVHTFNFLKQIPWTEDLSRLPDIALGHHEKMDGSGYPHGLKGEDIPHQSKMMTISDIYDALTSPDRPYKHRVPVHRALDILKSEVTQNKLSSELFDLFVDAEVFKVLGHSIDQ